MEIIKRTALWIFLALLAYMPLHILLSTWVGTSFSILEPAKAAKDVLLIAGFLLVVIASTREPWFRGLLRDKLVRLIAAYAFLTFTLAVIKPTDLDAEILGVVYNLRFLAFLLYGLLLGKLYGSTYLRKAAVRTVLTIGALVVAFGIFQYMLLPDDALKHVGYSRENGVLPAFFIDNKPDLERVMSTVRDPNSLGSYLAIVAPLALALCLLSKGAKARVGLGLLAAASALCTLLTFSRSAWIGFTAAIASFAVLSDNPLKRLVIRQKRTFALTGVIAIVVFAGSFLAFRSTYFVQNVILHADESTVMEDPNELRIRFFRESVEHIAANPLGSGPGTAGLASIRNGVQGTQLNENYYLQIAFETGVLGLILFIAILAVTWRRLYTQRKNNMIIAAALAAFIGLAVTNFLVHIWANEAVAYTWWGLAGILLSPAIVSTKHANK